MNLWVHEGEWQLGSELASKGAEVELHLYLGSNISDNMFKTAFTNLVLHYDAQVLLLSGVVDQGG